MKNRIAAGARAGFTLVEVLVTLVLIALLVGVIVPSVMNQLGRGDNTRIMNDLEGIRAGAKMFRIDVKRYPSTIEQLVEDPCQTDADADGECEEDWSSFAALPSGTISDNLVQRWAGPYVEGLDVTVNTAVVETALGGEIQGTFVPLPLSGVDYLVVQVAGLTQADIASLDTEFDDGVATSGRLQTTGTEGDPLDFYAIPLN